MKKFNRTLFAMGILSLCACSSDNDVPSGSGWETSPIFEVTETEAASLATSNDFGIDFMNASARAISSQAKTQNFIVSPLSAHEALGMLANAVDATNRDAIVKALGFADIDQLNSVNDKLLRYIPFDTTGNVLNIANSFWYNERLSVTPEFSTTLSDKFKATVSKIDFSDPDVHETINKWCDRNTNGMINNVVNKGTFTDNTVFTLANALYFKGSWDCEFDEDDTKDGLFTTRAGSRVTVPFMNKDENMMCAAADEVKMISLPYKGLTKYMDIVLPPEGVDMINFAAGFGPEQYRSLVADLSAQRAILSLPKFELNTSEDITNVLNSLGIPTAGLDASDIGLNEPVSSLKMKQCNAIKVNEKGSEIAAVTIISADGSMRPVDKFRLIADRPFMFFIRDSKTGVILMAGGIGDPTAE